MRFCVCRIWRRHRWCRLFKFLQQNQARFNLRSFLYCGSHCLTQFCTGLSSRHRGQRGICGGGCLRQIRAHFQAGRDINTGYVQARQRLFGICSPAIYGKLMRAAFARECRKVGGQRFKLVALCGLKQADVQGQPGAIQFYQAIGRNFFFLDQGRCRFDQFGRALARFAPGNHHLVALLGGAVHAPVVGAEFALGEFQRFLAYNRVDGGLLDIHHWRILGDRQQGGIIAHRGL